MLNTRSDAGVVTVLLSNVLVNSNLTSPTISYNAFSH